MAMNNEDMAILKSLVVVAWVDGQVHEHELEHIEALINAFGADETQANEVRDFAKSPRGMADIPITDLSRDDRRVLLNHAVVLTHIDGEQTEKERQVITDLTAALRIDDGEATRIVEAAEARVKRLLQMTA
jgi:tellurite resistance protein